jgi:hypothetical protein
VCIAKTSASIAKRVPLGTIDKIGNESAPVR